MPGIKTRSRKRKRSSTDSTSSKKAVKANSINSSRNSNSKQQSPPKKRLKIDVEAAKKEAAKALQLQDAAKATPQSAPRRSPNGYLLPDKLPVGLILKDLRGHQWVLGKSVGLGGFGEIYSAVSLDGVTGEFVVKVEPFSNGPLFVEINFYLRSAKREAVKEYKAANKMEHLGVPHVEGTGSFFFRDKKFRFLVIPRYGTDLQTLLDDSKLTLSRETACDVASQVVDSYQYIHSKGYVHKDVKGSNLLYEGRKTNLCSSGGRKVYLVDYGLVSKYTQLGVHKPYVRDERCAHEGTLEYASRDAHLGCVSRRGDIEVLLYNIIDWIGGKLPWDKPEMDKPTVIQESKIRAFHDCEAFLSHAFQNKPYPAFVLNLMRYVSGLGFEEAPDYNYVRSLFHQRKANKASSKATNNGAADVSLDSSADEVTLSIEVKPQQSRHPSTIVPAPATEAAAAAQPVERPKQRPLGKRVLRKRNNSGDSFQSSSDVSSECSGSSSNTEENEDDRDMEELRERILSDESAKRFSDESDVVIRLTTENSLQNPTPLMLQQIQKIEHRKRVGIPAGSQYHGLHGAHGGHGHRRRRNRSLCRSAVLAKRRKSTSDIASATTTRPAKKLSRRSRRKTDCEDSCPDLHRHVTPRTPPKSTMKPSKSESVLRHFKSNKKLLVDTYNTMELRRSPRIKSPACPDSANKTPDENAKRESFRKNISDFFANVTRSILRIKG